METPKKIPVELLAPYLPYNLEGMANINYDAETSKWVNCTLHGITRSNFIVHCKSINGEYWPNTEAISFYGFKPLLIPLDKLTEGNNDYLITEIINGTDSHCDAYDEWLEAFIDNPDQTRIMQAPYEVFNELVKQHYDVHGLITAGLAIDKTTFKI